MKKRILAGLLSFAMVVSMMPSTVVFAEETENGKEQAEPSIKNVNTDISYLSTNGEKWDGIFTGHKVTFGKFGSGGEYNHSRSQEGIKEGYKQCGTENDYNEAMTYRVLKLESGQALLDCDNKIITLPWQFGGFDEAGKNIEWHDSSLRNWLNGSEFYNNNNVFSPMERSVIAETNNSAKDEYTYYSSIFDSNYYAQDYQSEDNVFLLSIDEIGNYYKESALGKEWNEYDYYNGGGGIKQYSWTRSSSYIEDADDDERYGGIATYGYVGSVKDFKYHYGTGMMQQQHTGTVGVSPAFNIDASKIFYTYESGKDKPAKLTDVKDSDAMTWTLTLEDGNDGFEASTEEKQVFTGDNLNITVSSLGTPGSGVDYTQLTGFIYNADETEVLSYGKVADAEAGDVTVELPDSVKNTKGDYILRVFAEDVNSSATNGLTDYSSNYVDIPFTVKPEHEWSYSAKNQEIIAVCDDPECDYHSNPLKLTLTASNQPYSGKAYTGADIKDDITDVTGAEADPVRYTGRNGTTYPESADAPVNTGDYTAAVTVNDDGRSVTATADFTITKADITPVVSLAGWIVGGIASTPEVTGNDGNAAVTYFYKKQKAGDDTYIRVTDFAAIPAGSYTLKASIAESENYKAKEVTCNFTVTKQPVTVSTAIEGWTYGETAKMPSVKIMAESGDVTDSYDTAKITYTYYTDSECRNRTTSADGAVSDGAVPENAGSYYVKADVAETDLYFGSRDAAPAAFVIKKAAVTVIVDAVTKHIGKADPSFTYQAAGLVKGGFLKDITFTRTKGEAAGDYDVTATAKDGSNPNYDITFVPGKLTIEEHVPAVDPAKAPTCTKTGLTEGSHCSVCKEVLVAQNVTDALGHDWSEWVKDGNREKSTCSRCGQAKFRTVETDDTGNLEKDAEVTQDSPVTEATLDSKKTELLAADGIFTEEEKAAIENGAAARVWIEISAVKDLPDADRQKVEAEAAKIMGSDITKIVYFNADLFQSVTKDGATTKSQITEPGTEMEVSVSLPESLLQEDSTIARAYKMIRLHNGEVDSFGADFDRETGTLSFKTDRFSTYAIAFTDTQLVTGVAISSGDQTLTKKGETVQLTAVVSPDNAADKNVTWTSADSSVATVDANGLVTAVGNGTTVITVTTEDGRKTASVTVTVRISQESTDTAKPETEPSKKPSSENTVSEKEQEQNALTLNAKLKVSQTGSQINIGWGEVKEADGYDVYVQYCGKKYNAKSLNQVLSGTKTKIVVKKVNGKKLDLKKNYKIYVAAYKLKDGKKVILGKTITAHIVGRRNLKQTNVKQVKVKKTSYSLSVGKTAKIKAGTVLVDKRKKPLSNAHAKELRYASGNRNVVTVTKKGQMKAVAKGTCTVYVYARNGYTKKIKVTVK